MASVLGIDDYSYRSEKKKKKKTLQPLHFKRGSQRVEVRGC